MNGYIFATEAEALPFLRGLPLTRTEEKPFKVYKNGKHVLIISCIGKVNAAIAVSYLVWKYSPFVIFNIGSAGAVKSEIKTGEIYHINRIVEPDRPRLSDGKTRIITPENTLEGFATAALATQDRVILTKQERQEILEYADLVDMEGASIVQACKLLETVCYLFKFVSDTPEHEKTGDIIKNIKTYSETMFDFFNRRVSMDTEIQEKIYSRNSE